MYLSPAAIGREVFDNTLEQLLGLHSLCQGSLPCARLVPSLVWWGKIPIGSRVRFMDAVPATEIGEDQYFDRGVLAELASRNYPLPNFISLPRNETVIGRPCGITIMPGTGARWKEPDFETWAEYAPDLRGKSFIGINPTGPRVYHRSRKNGAEQRASGHFGLEPNSRSRSILMKIHTGNWRNYSG